MRALEGDDTSEFATQIMAHLQIFEMGNES